MNKKEITNSLSDSDSSANVVEEKHHSHHHHHHGEHHGGHHHSGHHRGSHRRHHKRRRSSSRQKSSKNKENKFIKFLKRHRGALINAVSCAISIFLLILLAINYENKIRDNKTNDQTVDITQSTVKIESTLFLDDVSLTHQAVIAYLNDVDVKSATDIYKKYSGYNQDLDAGLPVKYTYRVTGLPKGIYAENATLDLSQSPDFNETNTYPFEEGAESIEIYHLLPSTQYYYRLNVTLSSGTEIGTTGKFKTSDSPRMLSIEGIHNVRDIGGWETISGKRIKYGLLYRGTELDGGVKHSYCLTEKGLKDMISVLGVKFDMDLRSETDNNGDALGNDVVHKNYAVDMYSGIFNEKNDRLIRAIFADLANKDNYPIYMHCTYGKDRTGTICYLLEALLGMSDEDLRREYELSAFTDSYINGEEFAVLVARIKMLEGNNTQEKVEGYLRSIGVTAEEIANIREIFLGE